jgi:hypothetical protein
MEYLTFTVGMSKNNVRIFWIVVELSKLPG